MSENVNASNPALNNVRISIYGKYYLFGGGGPHTARARAKPPPPRPALMSRAAHAVESKAAVRIEVAVSPRPCLGCAVELALRVAPLRRGVPPR
jgi:hypothetical protein